MEDFAQQIDELSYQYHLGTLGYLAPLLCLTSGISITWLGDLFLFILSRALYTSLVLHLNASRCYLLNS